jgi:hypothetical protein
VTHGEVIRGGAAPTIWDDPEREQLAADLAAVTEQPARARLEPQNVKARLAAATRFHDRLGEETVSAGAPPHPHPSDQVRGLFRTLIKLCHPDLAADDADRLRREEFTARVNAAYAANNAAWLAELAREWQAGPLDAAATAPGQVPELRAAIELARRQLSEVRAEIARLTTAGLGELLFGSEDPRAAVQRIADEVRAEFRRQWDLLRRLRS